MLVALRFGRFTPEFGPRAGLDVVMRRIPAAVQNRTPVVQPQIVTSFYVLYGILAYHGTDLVENTDEHIVTIIQFKMRLSITKFLQSYQYAQLVKKFPALHVTRRFITVFATARLRSLS
jgi:hypothetical protein